MENPRNTNIIIEELHDLNMVIEQAKKLAEKYPDDFAIQVILQQDQQRRKQLMKELHLSLSFYFYEQAA